jgi:transposase-like protein
MSHQIHAPLFRHRHFSDDVIILAVRWYLRFSLSYRDLEELLRERGVAVDHTTLWRWIQRYAPEFERRLRSHLANTGQRWHVDETYVRVAGNWTYLYRAVDEHGATVDFYLSEKRDVRAAKLFLGHAIETLKRPAPIDIVADGNPTYPIAVRALQRDGILPKTTRSRCPVHGNNRIEQDHRSVQQRLKAKQSFRSLDGARRTVAGYEAMSMLRKGQVLTCARGDTVAQTDLITRLLIQGA